MVVGSFFGSIFFGQPIRLLIIPIYLLKLEEVSDNTYALVSNFKVLRLRRSFLYIEAKFVVKCVLSTITSATYVQYFH